MEEKTHLVCPEIMDQITLARDSLVNHPSFSLARAHAECKFLKNSANRHSVEMEIPESMKRHRRIRRQALKYLTDAQYYLNSRLVESPQLTEEIIKKTAAHVNGYNGQMCYRNVSAFAKLYNYQYEDPSEISNQVYLFLDRNNSLVSNVEKSLHFHFHATRIHPFADGNGRLARLTGNAFLGLERLPPIEIHPLGRREYCDLLNAAQREYRETKKLGSSQSRFYNFLAMKIRDSLERMKTAVLK